jgi:cytochrome d ubiquinol oxidase subunit II
MMETVWFVLVALMIAIYVVLDGFDLGAGAIHLLAARTARERRLVLRSIGPVWDGNEVWLVAAGGTLYFAFPELYATALSGFYLPLMMVLWLLILRGIAIEFRNHLRHPIWSDFWDVVFSLASALLAVFLGAALGNVVRGVPLDASGRFFAPLWTDLRLGPEPGVIDGYTCLAGLTALAALTQHGALWVALKTEGRLGARARRCARAAFPAVAALTALLTAVSFRIQPQVRASFAERPWGAVFPALALGGLAAAGWLGRRGDDRRAFLGSCAFVLGMIASTAFGLYPLVLPAVTHPERSLTVHGAAAGAHGLAVALIWWTFGMALVAGYFVFTYRHFAGKVREEEGEGY